MRNWITEMVYTVGALCIIALVAWTVTRPTSADDDILRFAGCRKLCKENVLSYSQGNCYCGNPTQETTCGNTTSGWENFYRRKN